MNGYKKQLEFLDWEFGLFFHFGIRSFYPGHKDWDGDDMSPERFNPESVSSVSLYNLVRLGLVYLEN